MSQRIRAVATAIVSLAIVVSLVGTFWAHISTPPLAKAGTSVVGTSVAELAAQVTGPYRRAMPASFHLSPDAKMVRVPAEDAIVTGGNGFLHNKRYIWKGFGRLRLEGETTFPPKLVTLHVNNPVPNVAAIFVELAYILPNGTQLSLGMRKILGKQFGSFVFPASSAGMHKFQFNYIMAEPLIGRPPLEFLELIISE